MDGHPDAGVAELADARVSKTRDRKVMRVRPSPPALHWGSTTEPEYPAPSDWVRGGRGNIAAAGGGATEADTPPIALCGRGRRVPVLPSSRTEKFREAKFLVIKKSAEISVNGHGSRLIAIVGHDHRSGNPADKDIQ